MNDFLNCDAKIKKYRIDCDCRKPKLGMYNEAIKDFDLDLSHCYAIGDKIRDCAICKTTKCKGYLVGHNELLEIISQVQEGCIPNVKYSESLAESAKSIIAE